MIVIKFLPLSFLILFIIQDIENTPIPEHLLECYQNNIILLPMTMTTLIDIIRKIEFNHEYIMDMRMVSNSIMRRFWRDGIKRDPDILPGPGVITYSTASFQSYKYLILYSNLLPGTGTTFPNDTLTVNERCTLHFMISGSVDPWERGDESQVCKGADLTHKQMISFTPTGMQRSSCPIEKGVIMTNGYGTISAGHVILAIAMGLQPMQVTQSALIRNNLDVSSRDIYNKSVDNLWAATICGDLAEVLVFQTPITNNVTLGPPGYWNNSNLPTDYYMKTDQNFIEFGCWQDTDAEIIGSVDGLILAKEAVKLNSIIYTLKLSQILELYYTNIGRNELGQIHACKRKQYFWNDLGSLNEIIKQQTINFAEILAITAPHSFVHDEMYLQHNIDRVYKTFIDYTRNLLGNPISCPDSIKLALPKLQLNVIYDSTWSPYYTLQFLMRLSSLVDVSYYGSNITVINGANGVTIVDSANTEGELYLQWMNFIKTYKDVKSSGLLEGFLQLKRTIENNITQSSQNVASGSVTIVLGATSSISDKDFSDILSILRAIKTESPDMIFFYLTSQGNNRAFIKFTTLPRAEDDSIVISDNKDQNILLKDLNYIMKIPRMLIPPSCTGIKTFTDLIYEEYITPEQIYIYKIHPSYMCTSNKTVTIKIKNYDYGNLDVSISRTSFTKDTKENITYKSASFYDEIEFTVDNDCSLDNLFINTDWNRVCKPVFLKVIGRRSLKKCTERDCRFPDQLRYSINVKGLKCIKDMQVTCTSCRTTNELLYLCVILCFSLIINNIFKRL